MAKKRNIPVVNSELFVRDYFNHANIKQHGINLNTITPREQTCYFYISKLENAAKYINFPLEAMKTTFYEVVFLTKGQCIVTDNLNDLSVSGGQMRFVAPGKIVSVKEPSADIEGYYIQFDQAFIDTYSGAINVLQAFPFFDLDAIPIISLNPDQTAFFAFILHKIQLDFTQNYQQLKPVICQYIISILKECNVFYEKIQQENKQLTSADKIAQEFTRLAYKHYLSKRSLIDYAELLNITPKHLTKCVKQATGNTPTEFIYRMLILEIKVLLKETTLSVSEIAYQLSFEDTAYFNRFFKLHAGVTPAVFRKISIAG